MACRNTRMTTTRCSQHSPPLNVSCPDRARGRARPFLALLLGLVAAAFPPARPVAATTITYEMVTVGDPGNDADVSTGSPYGEVAYAYQIGTYDVTIGQYTAFLNAVDPTGTNPHDIYNSSMAGDLNIAGIAFSRHASAGSKYSVMNNAGDSSNRPITYVSWFDAARFANWMTNGQGNGSTETGAYTLNGLNVVAANPGAAFSIPTENEWYKAAYYSPNYGGVGVPGYYKYPTQSDDAPGNNATTPTVANQANYMVDTLYSVTQSSDEDANQNYLTDVGAFTNSVSFYGTFDQGGNVYQWNDLDGTISPLRGVRGGDWNNGDPFTVSSSTSDAIDPSYEFCDTGFRLASRPSRSVPEIDPNGLGSVLAFVLGSLGLLECRRSRRLRACRRGLPCRNC
jgi:formylglycine-generating enzyme